MKPIITLKNFKMNDRMSEETLCFSADLLVDGKNVGYVTNHGHGGCHDYRFKPNADWNFTTLNDAIKASYEKRTNEYLPGELFDTDLDTLVDDVTGTLAAIKDLRKSMKRKVLVLEADGKTIREFYWKGVTSLTERHIESIRVKNYGTILNGMSDDELCAAIKGV